MRKLPLYLLLISLIVSVGFVTYRKIPMMPKVGKCKVTNLKKWERMEKRVLSRKFKNNRLELKLRITGSVDDNHLTITRYTGDTLYLRLQHPPTMVIDTINGKPDTAYISQGCFCDFYIDVDLTIENLRSDPKYIMIKRYLVIGDVMKQYDKNGKLGEVYNQ
jgi:hypothetical protein